jgi:hypothetical protein
MIEIVKIMLTAFYWLEYSGAWRVSMNSLENRKFGFEN